MNVFLISLNEVFTLLFVKPERNFFLKGSPQRIKCEVDEKKEHHRFKLDDKS